MILAAIIQMLQLHPRPLSKHAMYHHHRMPVMCDSDSQARISRKEMHEPPSASKAPSTSCNMLPHRASIARWQMSWKSVRKHVDGLG